MLPGSISIDCAPGEGADEGKLAVRARLRGSARGFDTPLALPWEVALWLGRVLQDPLKWIPLCPRRSLRVVLERDNHSGAAKVVVEFQGRLWFEALRTARAQRADGSELTIEPAAMLGKHICAHAHRVEELQSAKATSGVLTDQAALFASGSPMLLTRDQAIIEEAKKRAGLDTEYRGLGTGRFETLNSKVLLPLPTAHQYPAGMSEFDFQMARAKTMSRKQRRALLARLRQEG